MPLLEEKTYAKVIAIGKEAVLAMKQEDFTKAFTLGEDGWNEFPEPKHGWNESYDYATIFFQQALKIQDMEIAKLWLNRMIDNNNILHLHDGDVRHELAKFEFERGNYKQALDIWKLVVSCSGGGLRYFDNDKYKDFFLHPKKYMKNKGSQKGFVVEN